MVKRRAICTLMRVRKLKYYSFVPRIYSSSWYQTTIFLYGESSAEFKQYQIISLETGMHTWGYGDNAKLGHSHLRTL